MAQGEGPEFLPQYHKKKKKEREREMDGSVSRILCWKWLGYGVREQMLRLVWSPVTILGSFHAPIRLTNLTLPS
jgi:hypothetical protein